MTATKQPSDLFFSVHRGGEGVRDTDLSALHGISSHDIITAIVDILNGVYSGNGASGLTPTTKTADYSAAAGEEVRADASGGAITITVPNTAGAETVVKKIDSSGNKVTIAATGNVDGSSVDLFDQYAARRCIGTGTAVDLIGERKPFASFGLGRVTADVHTVDYTLVLNDDSKVIEMNSSSALALTIPPSASVVWAAGVTIEVYAMGTGQVTITPGAGVTLRAPNGAKSAHQYATIGLRYRGSNEWVISGDTTA